MTWDNIMMALTIELMAIFGAVIAAYLIKALRKQNG